MQVELYGKELSKVFKNASEKFFRSAGAYIRKVAANSIKKKRDESKHSKPGTPPFYHGSAFGSGYTFKKSILYKAEKESVVIGSISNSLARIGSLHEYGGTSSVEYIDHPNFGRIYKKGDIAPISTKHLKNYKGNPNAWKDPLTGYPVAIVKVPTQRLAEHATRLQARLLNADRRFRKTKQANYPARPFIRPAYETSEPYLLKMWKNTIN